nr:MAG TPA: hypothetical protein [Caudoviricetes sp.]
MHSPLGEPVRSIGSFVALPLPQNKEPPRQSVAAISNFFVLFLKNY